MSQTLINMLRFADRLKEAGFVGVQAEALARVLGDELTEQLPTKADFKTLEGRFDALEGRLDALEKKFDALEGRLDALEGKFGVLEAKFDGLRYTPNLVLALAGLLVALGLVELVSKLFGS